MAKTGKWPAKDDENFEDCPPKAEAIIHSLRAFGYDLGMAIADLIDNSIFAGAANVRVSYSWNDGDPWVRILDDGSGMTEATLVEAMRLGSRSPLEARDPEDLGRFGLGLKTASFSQCRNVTVHTKTADGTESTRFWDLDYVQHSRAWRLGKVPPDDIRLLIEPLQAQRSGTIVLWRNLDRVAMHDSGKGVDPKTAFLTRFPYVTKYLEMVFHQYLEDRRKKLNIFVGEHCCEPWDPYLRSNSFHQQLYSEAYEDSRVSVVPYVLPHVSHRDDSENELGAGIKGWNAHQGFYVYRNRRMIVSGGYLDFDLKPEEHCKLARIKVDITNEMDHEWSIDVRKAVASPPDNLRSELLRVAKATRDSASAVYRARTGRERSHAPGPRTTDIWLGKQVGDKIVYRLNADNPVLKRLLDELKPGRKWLRQFFHAIETTVPHRTIIMDGLEHEDCHVALPEDLNPPPPELLKMCREFYDEQKARGRSHEEATDIVRGIDPFDTHPGFRAFLDGIVEEG